MNMTRNYRVVLRSRPGQNGFPEPDNFRYEECQYPSRALRNNEVLIKTLFISVDPCMRAQMEEDAMGSDFLQAWEIGETIEGMGGVGVVIKSKHPKYQPGDYIQAAVMYPWIAHFIQDMELGGDVFSGVNKSMIHGKPSLILSLLGMTGLTALIGIREKARITKGLDQTVVVSGAAGSVGSLAGQIAKLEGCGALVGICGSNEKCHWLTNDLGFTYAINYKTENVGEKLKAFLPEGVDIYFDNVGGELSNVVLRQMAKNSTQVLCGQIAVYNQMKEGVPYPPPLPPDVNTVIKNRNINTDTDFLVLEYPEKYEDGILQLEEWYAEGKIRVRETVIEGLQYAGYAFASMMAGGNIGKQLVHVSDPYNETTL